MCIVIGVFLVAIIAPLLAPYPAIQTDLSRAFQPPSTAHIFGTDDVGADIFSRILYGAGISLQIGVVVLAIAVSVGVVLGALAGYLGGRVDEVIMRIADIFLAFPSLILALAIAAALGPSLVNTMAAISSSWWPWYARLVRSQTISIKEMQYFESAKAVGVPLRRIISKYIVPNSMAQIIVQASGDFGWVILVAAGLGFLGVGAQPPSPEWGLMIGIARRYFLSYPWLATFPGLAIIITVFGFNLLGDGLRDVFDPKLRRV